MTSGARSASSSRAAGLALVAISAAEFGTIPISAPTRAADVLTVGPALVDPTRLDRLLGIVLGVIASLSYAVYVALGSAVTPRAGPFPAPR